MKFTICELFLTYILEKIPTKKLKAHVIANWSKVILLLCIFVILIRYGSSYNEIIQAINQTFDIDNDENTKEICRNFLNSSGLLLAFFSIYNFSLLIFIKNKELLLKYLFIFFSTITLVYSSGIVYMDMQHMKTILEQNREYTQLESIDNIPTKIKYADMDMCDEAPATPDNITLSKEQGRYYLALLAEAKLYAQYKITAALVIILLSYAFLIIINLILGMSNILAVILLILFVLLS